ncbi:MAG: hypothetical protein JWM86_306, partial [Thermoleophilia bacterium]|nr:hypothetical protein [Thermoleophilia bacterium]
DNAMAAQLAVDDHVGLNHFQVLLATLRGK